MEDRLEDEERVEADEGLDPEATAGGDQAGLGAGLHRVRRDGEVADDADDGDAVAQFEMPTAVLRWDARG